MRRTRSAHGRSVDRGANESAAAVAVLVARLDAQGALLERWRICRFSSADGARTRRDGELPASGTIGMPSLVCLSPSSLVTMSFQREMSSRVARNVWSCGTHSRLLARSTENDSDIYYHGLRRVGHE
jgi:hypothetical protein